MLRRAHLRASTLNDGDSGEYSFNFDHNELLLGPQLLSAFSTSPLLAAVATQRTDACAVCYLTEIKICALALEPQSNDSTALCNAVRRRDEADHV